MFRACSWFYSHADEKSVRFKSKFVTRIFAVKIRVLNFEILRTRIFVISGGVFPLTKFIIV